MNPTIDDLVRDGSFEAVPADPASARRILDEARRHVAAARQIATLDPSGAYVLSYDAARKAVSAVLLAGGYRAMSVPGAHAATARAAFSFGASEVEQNRLRQLDQMRRHRNRSEYGVRSFSAQETEGAIDLAEWIIEFAHQRIG
ncbi:MAG TPA: HEPN domain-containing protein [Acidimicrobiia bacterium]|nr:HEPN domain-containing protein [Acidimicrobiia bacterium]